MGHRIAIAAIVAALTAGGPIVVPSGQTAEAQVGQNASCYCFASFDAIDSDMRFVSRYYNQTLLDLPSDACGTACDQWRRDWFYRNACDFPIRINRGRNAWWGYYDGQWDTHLGPETWWCPFPPP